MKKFLVVMSELPGHGRGVNGRTLVRFLRTYAGAGAVEACGAADLLDGGGLEAETVFLGLPSPVTGRHLARLSCRHLVLFDLSDWHHPLWTDLNPFFHVPITANKGGGQVAKPTPPAHASPPR